MAGDVFFLIYDDPIIIKKGHMFQEGLDENSFDGKDGLHRVSSARLLRGQSKSERSDDLQVGPGRQENKDPDKGVKGNQPGDSQ